MTQRRGFLTLPPEHPWAKTVWVVEADGIESHPDDSTHPRKKLPWAAEELFRALLDSEPDEASRKVDGR